MDKNLPIFEHAQRIAETVRANQVTIIVGETGSGKTTVLPSLLFIDNIGNGRTIGVTEPRRIAATSVARFVARELGVELGKEVGYQIRFDDETSPDTSIKFMTDGILLREFQRDPDLSNYSVIVVDEAHERSTNIDFVLGLLKELLSRREDLKLIVASATIDAKKFSRYFDDAPVIEVSGRMYPVEIVWGRSSGSAEDLGERVTNVVTHIHTYEEPGDVLVFVPGVDDINNITSLLERQQLKNVIVLPAHGALGPEDQQKIFGNYPGRRKVIIGTNIAETSITIDGVVYVVDTGLVKQTSFHPESGIQSLDVVEHSKAGCAQRAGRAGRTRPGVCYRLYSESNFDARPDYTEPEIKRMSLAGIVLQMEMLGLKKIEDFDFVDPPDQEAFHEAYETLISLGAITKGKDGLTELGRAMARLPLEPRIARMVLEAERHGCIREVATVAALLSVRNVFVRPKEKAGEADAAHEKFRNITSDILTLLNVWRAYEQSGYDRSWCFENFLHFRSLWEARNIRTQLLELLKVRGIKITEGKNDEAVARSVCAGLVYNLFEHESHHAYRAILRNSLNEWDSAFVHPGSSLFGWKNPRWLVASELVRTSKLFLRGCSEVNPAWLPDLIPARFSFGDIELLAHVKGGKTVSARRPVLDLQQSLKSGSVSVVGWKEELISLPEARLIQEKKITEAKQAGWTVLVVEGDSAFHRTARLPSGRIVEIRYSFKVHVLSGKTYCCSYSPQEGLGARTYSGYIPEFEVFDLEEGIPEEKITSADDLASRLATKFRVTR